jgi:hypothetical protein
MTTAVPQAERTPTAAKAPKVTIKTRARGTSATHEPRQHGRNQNSSRIPAGRDKTDQSTTDLHDADGITPNVAAN